jgi:hypothetical protein
MLTRGNKQKNVNLIVIASLSFMTTFMAAGISPAFVLLAADLNVTVSAATYLQLGNSRSWRGTAVLATTFQSLWSTTRLAGLHPGSLRIQYCLRQKSYLRGPTPLAMTYPCFASSPFFYLIVLN